MSHSLICRGFFFLGTQLPWNCFLSLVLLYLFFFFQSLNIGNLAKDSQNVSSVLNESALQTKDKVDNELSSLLEDIKNRLDLIKSKIQSVSGDLFDVAKNFPEFEEMAGLIGRNNTVQLNLY